MEPTEIIELSSDDEKPPMKIKESTPKIKKTKLHNILLKQEAAEENMNNKGDEDIEILYNPVSDKKRKIKSDVDNCPTKKIKLLDNGKISNTEVTKSELHLRNLLHLSKTHAKKSSSTTSDKLQSEISSTRSLGWPLEVKKTIISDGKSSSNTKKSTNDVKSWNNDSHLNDEQNSQPRAGPSSRSLDIDDSSSSMGPQLVVKNKVKVLESAEAASAPIKEMFQSLMEACIKKDSSKEMERIVNRFKKRFDNLEPGFAKSEFFMHLVRNKRNLISDNSTNTPYLVLAEVMDEMKARQIRKVQIIEYENENENKGENKVEEGKDSTKSKPDDKSGENCTINEEAGSSKDLKENKYLRALEKSMRRCQRLIQKCETAEVDFNDENDSYYILAERYKHRMVELYNKYCEITGERPDAARPHLRPKNLSPTPLPLLNNAITRFVNHKISKMNKLGQKNKNINFAEALIFPDYIDILKCVEKCNSEQNLKLSKAKEKEIAKKAFTDLGAHLQRSRQLDYYDTFSLYLEKEDRDPVLTDESLAEKLRKNGEIGKKKLNEVFEKFVAKQNDMAENPAMNPEDDLSNESSHNTENDSEKSENESLSTKLDDDFDEVEIVDPSTRLKSDSEQDDVQVDEHAEKKNNPTEKQEQSSSRSLDEEISQDVVQVDRHAEKKNNPTEKQEQSSIRSLDEEISQDDVQVDRHAEKKNNPTEKQEQSSIRSLDEEISQDDVQVDRHAEKKNNPTEKQEQSSIRSLDEEISQDDVQVDRHAEKKNNPTEKQKQSSIQSLDEEISQDDIQVDRLAEKKNNSTKKQEQSSIQSLDEEISLPHCKTEEKKEDMDTGEPGDEETSKSNEKILIKKNEEILSQKNDVSHISAEKIDNQSKEEKIYADISNNEECVHSSKKSPIKEPVSSVSIKKRLIGSVAKKSTAPNIAKKRVSLQPAFVPTKKTMDQPITETTDPSNNESSVPLAIPVAIVRPTSPPVIKEKTALPSSEKLDVNLACIDSLAIPAENTEVIANPAMAPTGETSGVQNEKTSLLRPRSFAKPSKHWTDFQASTSSNVTNSESSVTPGENKEVKKSVKISADKIEKIKLRKLCALSPLRKTDFKVKKTTLMIPRSVIGRNNTVSLKSVTNNITVLNIENQTQLRPKVTSVVSSYEADNPESVKKFGEGGAKCDDKMRNVTFHGHQSSEKINPARISTGNDKQCSVKVPANQKSANDREAVRSLPQRQYKILSPKNISSQIQTPKIRTLPVRDEHGKEIAYKLIKNTPAGSIVKRVDTSRGVAQSQTSRGSSQQANYNLARTNDSKLRFQIPQSINKKSPYIKVSNLKANNTNEISDASTDGVPLFVID